MTVDLDEAERRVVRHLHELAEAVEGSLDDRPAASSLRDQPRRARWVAPAAAAAVVAAGLGGWVAMATSRSDRAAEVTTDVGSPGDLPQLPGNDHPDERSGIDPTPSFATPGGEPTEEVLEVGRIIGAPVVLEWEHYDPDPGWRATYSTAEGALPVAGFSIGRGPDDEVLAQRNLGPEDLGRFLLPGSRETSIPGLDRVFVRENAQFISLSGMRSGMAYGIMLRSEDLDIAAAEELYRQVVEVVSES